MGQILYGTIVEYVMQFIGQRYYILFTIYEVLVQSFTFCLTVLIVYTFLAQATKEATRVSSRPWART